MRTTQPHISLLNNPKLMRILCLNNRTPQNTPKSFLQFCPFHSRHDDYARHHVSVITCLTRTEDGRRKPPNGETRAPNSQIPTTTRQGVFLGFVRFVICLLFGGRRRRHSRHKAKAEKWWRYISSTRTNTQQKSHIFQQETIRRIHVINRQVHFISSTTAKWTNIEKKCLWCFARKRVVQSTLVYGIEKLMRHSVYHFRELSWFGEVEVAGTKYDW